MDIQTLGTMIIAGYAALLSTVLGAHQIRSAAPRLKVKMNYCVLAPPVYGPNPLIGLSAANAGTQDIVLTGAGWRLPNGMSIVIPIPRSPNPFPYRVPPGGAHQMFAFESELQESLASEGLQGNVKLKPFYRDQVGRIHFGRKRIWNADTSSLLPASFYRRLFPKRLRVGE
jgi:hypothetical protein